MFIVKRAINGISINGDEFLLREDGSLWTFQSKGQARRILIQNSVDLDSVDVIEDNVKGAENVQSR